MRLARISGVQGRSFARNLTSINLPYPSLFLLAQVGGVVEGAEDGGAVGVPVDLAQGRDVEMHPVERGRRGEQSRGDERLDRGHVADDEDRLVGPFGQNMMQGRGHPLADLVEALPTPPRDRPVRT